MSSLFDKFFGKTAQSSELPEIYPMSLACDVFVRSDIKATYNKILTDTLERTFGIPQKYVKFLWDNCVQSNANKGLVTLLSEAMTNMSDLFLVFKNDVLRVATSEEMLKIRADYEKQASSPIGIYVSFKNYERTEMLRIYSILEYCVLASFHKTVNISKAVQIKIDSLRKSVSLADSSVAINQAKSIANALKIGRDVFLDAADDITTAKPEIAPTEKAIGFIDAKKSFYLGLPISYITGLQTTGLGANGQADAKAVDRGLKPYFYSIINPVLFELFGIKTHYKSQDYTQIATALEAAKTFELISDDILSQEAKQQIIARLFDLDPKDEEKAKRRESQQQADQVTEADQLENDDTV